MIESLCNVDETNVDQHTFKVLELNDEHFNTLRDYLISKLPEHYLSSKSFARTMESLGHAVAYEKLKLKFPISPKIRSGDIGEIISCTLIYAELSGDFPLGNSRQPTYKSLRPFDLVS